MEGPYMDQLMPELGSRFQKPQATCTLLWSLLPKFCQSFTGDRSNRLLTKNKEEQIDQWFLNWGVRPSWGYERFARGSEYGSDILLESRIMANKLLFCFLYLIWRLGEARVTTTTLKGGRLLQQKSTEGPKIEMCSRQPSNTIAALLDGHQELFPNARNLLQILAALPFSTITAERSFSTQLHLKTYLRTTMESDRLTGMALKSMHKNRPINKDILKDIVDLSV